MADFRLGVRWVCERLRHFLSKHFAIPPPQPMHRHLDRADGQIELRGDWRVGRPFGVALQVRPEQIKQFRFAREGEFVPQPAASAFQRGQRPTPVELAVWRTLLACFEREALLGILRIQRNDFLPAAALERLRVAIDVMEKVVERREQERAEAPAPGIGEFNRVAREQFGEESLGQVASVFGIVPAPANVSIERIPVSLAESGESRVGCGRVLVASRDDDAPMRGS